MKRTILIAATSSGSGKTTLTAGLLRLLSRKGYRVQPFKCGPDYIDLQYHRIACGVPSLNLDIWMNGKEAVRRLVEQSDADINIIEGAMGLYDGADGMTGSAAEVAEAVGAEVVLIVDGRSMAHSVAPLLYGYLHWRPATRVRAVVFNNVGSERHAEALRRAAAEVGIECLGCLSRQRDLYSPSRHLGLDILESERISAMADRVADALEGLPGLAAFTGVSDLSGLSGNSIDSGLLGDTDPSAPVLYLASDAAFNFCYRETELLLAKHFRIKKFSPLSNEPVGDDAAVVYLPGGYPELFLDALGKSTSTMESLRRTQARILAECGGMMYLSRAIDDVPMTGLLPFATSMEGARLHLGYRQMEWKGEMLRGHEFHYSKITGLASADDLGEGAGLSTITGATGNVVDTLFYVHNRLMASYIHWSPESILKLIEARS